LLQLRRLSAPLSLAHVVARSYPSGQLPPSSGRNSVLRMRPRVVDLLVCPICIGDLTLDVDEARDPGTGRAGIEVEKGTLACSGGHVFPVREGVPRLGLTDAMESADSRSIRESFSRQWKHYDYEAEDRTWGQTRAERRADFVRFVDMPTESLSGKLVLDAGCGNGLLSGEMRSFGCEVLAADISDSVEDAYRYFAKHENEGLHFVQADLLHPPFRAEAFDIVFCAGVLIVTPDSRATLNKVARAVASGGTLFIWLYWREEKLTYRIKTRLRRFVAPLPLFARRVVAVAFVCQAMVRQVLRRIYRRGDPGEQASWRERLVIQLDFFTPRYRWEHTPEEVRQWLAELGFTEMKLTEEGPSGFGMVARRPVTTVGDEAELERAPVAGVP
jgi:2-polyprenyl-3-methyl-5-hydroxy-6-metoxy-1,4-benzoquinol methylase